MQITVKMNAVEELELVPAKAFKLNKSSLGLEILAVKGCPLSNNTLNLQRMVRHGGIFVTGY